MKNQIMRPVKVILEEIDKEKKMNYSPWKIISETHSVCPECNMSNKGNGTRCDYCGKFY